jgi:predicted transcriptional regulator
MKRLANVYFKKTDLATSGNVTLDQNMLKLLFAIDENKTILEIAKEIKLDPTVFKQSLVKLYKLKLIEKKEKEVEYIDAKFLNNVRDTLVQLLGPLGEVLMDDAAEEMDTERSKIPKTLVAEYLMAIAEEIPSEKQKSEFKKNMLGEIKAMDK